MTAPSDNYKNPLDNFRSHSYHFILTLANTTEAFRDLIDGGDGFLSSVNSIKLGEKFPKNDAYLLVDTRRYSQYSVSHFEASQIYGTGSTSNPSVPASFIKMRIIDTTGLSFFNFISDTMKNKLKSTKASTFFMLAIIFTGHDDTFPNTNTYTISTTYIPMIMNTMGFEFSSSGSVYDIEFVETEGNPGQGVPQMVDLGDIQNISTEGKANTVGGMLQALEDRLNKKSKDFYAKYTNDANAAEAAKTASTVQTTGKTVPVGKKGKMVQYMIAWPPEWDAFIINTAAKDKNVEQVFVSRTAKSDEAAKKARAAAQTTTPAPTQAKSTYHAFSYSTNIQDAIKVILESSKDFIDLGSEKRRVEGKAVVQKTVISITSDDNTFLIHYDIYPYSAPKVDPQSKTEKNLITYDYIFTGKNSHILDLKIQFDPHQAVAGLDMDLNMGQSRFANVAKQGQSTKAVEGVSKGLKKTSDYSPTQHENDPVFLPLKTREQQHNFGAQNNEELSTPNALGVLRAKQEHSATMAVIHFVGTLQTQMTIRGNPNLLRKYADRESRNGIAKHTLSKPEYIKAYYLPRLTPKTVGDDKLLTGPDVSVGPVFVKINIIAPNVDYQGIQIPNAPLYTDEFFYKGAYFVALITHVFDGASFKQILTLLPWDIDGAFSTNTTK